jgi:glutathione synthase/RimK-type ligase-like ATP-grasp enzyme
MFPRRKIQTIGSVELIKLPEYGVNKIPAKIDTGADSSSIWASDISVNNGILEFALFAPGNQFHTGEKIRTAQFRSTSVKNTSGVGEFRYMVRVLVTIGDRNIRVWFNLSDRANMTYPVLLGRNFLKNKFVVDVSKLKVHTRQTITKKVLVLSSQLESMEEFFAEVSAALHPQKVKFMVRSYEELAFLLEKNKVKVIETKTSKDIASFDMVYFKSHRRYYPVAISAAQYLRYKNVKFFDRELSTQVSYDKLSAYMHLALYGLPIPRTLSGSKDYIGKNYQTVTSGKWPLVCKEIQQDRGRKNYLVHNLKELKLILNKADKTDRFIIQQFIPNDGYLRVYVFGREAPIGIFRTLTLHKNPQKQHLNNPTGSSNASYISESELDPVARDIAIRGAELMNRQVAGVDLVKSKKSKRWYILEANSAPQLKSGSFVDKKKEAVAKFIDFELNR